MAYKPTGRNHAGSRQLQQDRPPADRDAYRRRRDALGESIAARLDRGAEMDELEQQIRGLTSRLRDCRTPAERAEIEALARPLVRQRRSLGSWAN